MATRAPPAGVQGWRRNETNLIVRLLSRPRVLNGGAHSRDICVILTKTRKFRPALNYFYRPESPEVPVCITEYVPVLFSQLLPGILPNALRRWNPAGLVSQNHNYFLMIKNESQDWTRIDHSPPVCKSWNQVIFTSPSNWVRAGGRFMFHLMITAVPASEIQNTFNVERRFC